MVKYLILFCALFCNFQCAPIPEEHDDRRCPSVIELKEKQLVQLGFTAGSYKLGKLDVRAAPANPFGFIMTCDCEHSTFEQCEFSLGVDLFEATARQAYQIIEKLPSKGPSVLLSPVFTCGSDSKYSVAAGQSGPSVKKNSGGRVDQ
uniref:Uncharacterized protein n=1 Tax=Plectus sambesii TaxID=2011161 RepID=A0A914XJW3_9BILA